LTGRFRAHPRQVHPIAARRCLGEKSPGTKHESREPAQSRRTCVSESHPCTEARKIAKTNARCRYRTNQPRGGSRRRRPPPVPRITQRPAWCASRTMIDKSIARKSVPRTVPRGHPPPARARPRGGPRRPLAPSWRWLQE
jgi:hypothetical protein